MSVSSVKVGDLDFPEGVTPTMDKEVLVALVAKSRASVSEEAGGGGEEAEAAEGEGEEGGSEEDSEK